MDLLHSLDGRVFPAVKPFGSHTTRLHAPSTAYADCGVVPLLAWRRRELVGEAVVYLRRQRPRRLSILATAATLAV